jgi:hypothetical protein
METVEIVRVEVAVPIPGVMAAGEKEQLRELGSAGQESEMGLFETPDCAVALTVTLPDFPARTLTDVGDAPNETPAGGAVGGVGGAAVAGHVGL